MSNFQNARHFLTAQNSPRNRAISETTLPLPGPASSPVRGAGSIESTQKLSPNYYCSKTLFVAQTPHCSASTVDDRKGRQEKKRNRIAAFPAALLIEFSRARSGNFNYLLRLPVWSTLSIRSLPATSSVDPKLRRTGDLCPGKKGEVNLLPRQRLAWLSGGDTRERERAGRVWNCFFFLSPLLTVAILSSVGKRGASGRTSKKGPVETVGAVLPCEASARYRWRFFFN